MARRRQRGKSGGWPLSLYATLAALYCGGLAVMALFGDRGYLRGYAIYQERQRAAAEIDRLTLENQRLQAMLRDLEVNPRLLERKAREDLGLARRDELVYLFIDPRGRGR